jgi:GxxExxY protein
MDVFEFRERGNSGVAPATEEVAQRSIGAMIEVHKHLGPGLPETAYQNALSHELQIRGIPHEVEVSAAIYYKGKEVGKGRVDILVSKVLVLELKVVEHISDVHIAQTLSYLKTLKLQLGLIANFNIALMRNGIRRVVNTE